MRLKRFNEFERVNESFYDRIVAADKDEEREVTDEMIDELKDRLLTACKSGQVKDLSKSDNIYHFTVNKRKFKLDCGDECTISVSGTRQGNGTFDFPKGHADEVSKNLDKLV